MIRFKASLATLLLLMRALAALATSTTATTYNLQSPRMNLRDLVKECKKKAEKMHPHEMKIIVLHKIHSLFVAHPEKKEMMRASTNLYYPIHANDFLDTLEQYSVFHGKSKP